MRRDGGERAGYVWTARDLEGPRKEDSGEFQRHGHLVVEGYRDVTHGLSGYAAPLTAEQPNLHGRRHKFDSPLLLLNMTRAIAAAGGRPEVSTEVASRTRRAATTTTRPRSPRTAAGRFCSGRRRCRGVPAASRSSAAACRWTVGASAATAVDAPTRPRARTSCSPSRGWGYDLDRSALEDDVVRQRLGAGRIFAADVVPAVTMTFGGVEIDPGCRLLDANDEPVRNLYAAGGDASDVYHPGFAGGLCAAAVTGRVAGASSRRGRDGELSAGSAPRGCAGGRPERRPGRA